MNKLVFITTLLLVGIVVSAQDIFFPSKVGTELVYKTFDKRDKETSTVKYKVTDLKVSGKDMDITYQFESLDNKDKLVFKDEITIHKKGDVLYLDMSNFINKAMFQQNGEISPEIEISGNNIQIPSNLKPGDVLPDANVDVSMKMGFMSMKASANVTNRKVEAKEDITVKAGTFTTYKFTSEVTSSVMGIKVSSKSIEWFAKGIGVVKSEQYNKKDKLESYTELISFKK